MKKLTSLIISLSLLILLTGVPASTNGDLDSKGNTTLKSFSKAKKILLKQVYRDRDTTFYSQCQFTKDKKIIHSSGYVPKKKWKRAHRLEWEHIVPAHAFGLSFKEWREGHPKCKNRKGNPSRDETVPEKLETVSGLGQTRSS